MFLSRIDLNPQRRATRKFVANPRAMHAAVESSFPPGTKGRHLWRIDPHDHALRLYIVSPSRPDLRHVQEQAGWDTAPGESTDYQRFLDGLMVGQQYAFALTANPVKSASTPTGRGKVVPLVGNAGQLAWFMDRAPKWGIEPVYSKLDAGLDQTVGEIPLVNIGRNSHLAFGKTEADGTRITVTQRHVNYSGYVKVTDTTALASALVQGVGRGKAYGCGLLTLARE